MGGRFAGWRGVVRTVALNVWLLDVRIRYLLIFASTTIDDALPKDRSHTMWQNMIWPSPAAIGSFGDVDFFDIARFLMTFRQQGTSHFNKPWRQQL